MLLHFKFLWDDGGEFIKLFDDEKKVMSTEEILNLKS